MECFHDAHRESPRCSEGHEPTPTAVELDSQPVKMAGRGPRRLKKVVGRKRDIEVDTLGLIQALFVQSADLQDRDAAREFGTHTSPDRLGRGRLPASAGRLGFGCTRRLASDRP